MESRQTDRLPAPTSVELPGRDLDELLAIEWLRTNRIGAYASSTVAGCNTRRYHGLLVAATAPPVGRIVALSTVMERLEVPEGGFDLAMNEFPGSFTPHGIEHLAIFRDDVAPTFVYRAGGAELVKEITLAEAANSVAVRYTLRGRSATLRVCPFAAMRDFHHLRRVDPGRQLAFRTVAGGVTVSARLRSGKVGKTMTILSREAAFEPDPQWWYQFNYRQEALRGQDNLEDLFTPGAFVFRMEDGGSCQLTASVGAPVPLGFSTTVDRRRQRLSLLAAVVGDDADEPTRRLAVASDAFLVRRSFPNAPDSATLLAGYPWFADWGRDTFVALPGLLLETGRFAEAEDVFRTFAGALSDGMIPNRFDDYSASAHYNSIDASLWFILAAERYLSAGGDPAFWRDVLLPAASAILTAYQEGTRFDIRADADGLLTGGSRETQLTWMDAKLDAEAITPRHGKAVEVNALWYCAHRAVAERCRGLDDALADRCDHAAGLIAPAFRAAFWNGARGSLYDCVTDGVPDPCIRPNQIFAVSLPYAVLEGEQAASVVGVVERELLTPFGLRTLSPRDPRYRRRYGGSWESRDRAYHQGTVWPWLIGPFVEAYLKVHEAKPFAVARAGEMLSAFDDQLGRRGLGFLSEIHDGDRPHAPRGCIAQAWSVGEVLRVKRLVARLASEG